MTRLAFFAFVTALLLCKPAISDDRDAKAPAKTKTTTTGQVVIEINGVPQVIQLDSSPGILKKQLKNITEELNKKRANTNGAAKKQTSKTQSSSGNISYHTIIVGPDGVVKEEKVEKSLDGGALNNKQIMKGLPEQARKQIEAALKQAGKNGVLQMKIGADKIPAMMSKKIDIMPLLKSAGADLPAEVRKQLMEAIQGMDASGMKVGNVQARAIVIGPDGKKQEYNFDSDTSSTPTTKNLKAAGNEGGTTKSDEKVLETLGRILERLDKIENELETLKTANE
ncbi:MAG: hypothetical protein CMM01_21020 [Rhodopirellula sp.]|nr:hypothetical protein [Rhodopirellula sp.]